MIIHRLKKAIETGVIQQVKNDVNQEVKSDVSQPVNVDGNQSVVADALSQPVNAVVNQAVNTYATQPVKAYNVTLSAVDSQYDNQTITANSVRQAPDYSQRLSTVDSRYDSVKPVEAADDVWDTARVDEEEDLFHKYEKVLNDLDEFYERMRNSLSEDLLSDPQTFVPAVKAFIESGNRVLNADGPSLCSALKTFGK